MSEFTPEVQEAFDELDRLATATAEQISRLVGLSGEGKVPLLKVQEHIMLLGAKFQGAMMGGL